MEHGENLPSNALFSVDNSTVCVRRLTPTLVTHVHDTRDAYASLITVPEVIHRRNRAIRAQIARGKKWSEHSILIEISWEGTLRVESLRRHHLPLNRLFWKSSFMLGLNKSVREGL